MFKKLTAPTLKQLFVQELESMILSGELAIGQKLPPERELAERMQISRSVVNDGIAEMARKGFLEISPRQGTVVADFHRNGTLEILVSIMSYNGGQLPRDEIRSILELRGVLMAFALESAIPLITPELLARLNEQSEAFVNAPSPEEAATRIYTFDHMLSGFSGNTLLAADLLLVPRAHQGASGGGISHATARRAYTSATSNCSALSNKRTFCPQNS